MIKNTIEESVTQKTLSLLIDKFTVHRNDGEFLMSGHGRAYISEEGILLLQCSPDKISDIPVRTSKPGQMINDKDLCIVELEDEDGTVWHSMNVHIPISPLYKISGGGKGTIRLYEMETNSRTISNFELGGRMILSSNKKIELPRNVVTETKKSERVGSRRAPWRFSGASLDRARVKTKDFLIDFSWPGNFLECNYELTDTIPLFHDRICETVMFVSGQMPCKIFLARSYGNFESIVVYSRRDPPVRKQRTPSPHYRTKRRSDPYLLFKKYLTFAIKESAEDGWCHISREMASIMLTKNISVAAEILATCIAIEWMTKKYFPRLKIPVTPPETIEKIMSEIDSMRLNSSIKKRISDIVKGSLGQIRCKDVLRKLSKGGRITLDMIRTWDKNRNSSAHGNKDYEITHRTLSDSDTLFQLLILLVFKTIKYNGQYSDYSAEGWPVARIKPKRQRNPQTLSPQG